MKRPKMMIVLGGIAVILIFGLLWSHHRGKSQRQIAPSFTRAVQTVGAGDTNNEVLRTVLAKQNQLEKENAALKRQNEKLETQQKNQFADALNQAKAQMQNQLEKIRGMLGDQIAENKQAIDTKAQQGNAKSTPTYPIVQPTGTEQVNTITHMILQAPDAASHAPALPAETSSDQGNGEMSTTSSTTPPTLPSDELVQHGEKTTSKPSIPYYTLPANSTLNDVSLMTAMIAEVPVGGKLIEPAFGFKAIIGKKDLYAANGARLPQDISGMVVSGYAIGNMTMSCARAYVTQVLFVFSDGHFEVYPKKPTDDGTAIYPQNALGYLSDPYGNTCIAGKYLTDAPKVLASFAALGAVTAGGSAYAASQTTSQVSSYGSVSTLTGDLGKYMLGQGIAGGSQQALNWYSTRVSGIFDAVYIPASYRLKNGKTQITDVVLNLKQTIPIDYPPSGRRLDALIGHTGTMGQTLD